MIAIVSPEPSRPSSSWAMFAPVRPSAFFKSMSEVPPFSERRSGRETVSTGKTALTPATERRVATCEGATETDMPFQRES